MYKIFRNLLILATIMLCTITCVSANSEYTISGDMIMKYNGNADVVTVPAIIDGVEIAGIETGAFLDKDMHTVIIEEGIEVIQPKAFVGCENLEYVKSPESMLLINEDAFFECNMGMEIDACDTTYIMYDMSDFSFFGAGIENYEEYTTGGTTTGGEETGDEEICTFLYSGNTITGYEGTATDIEIPDYIDGVKITTIGASAFQDNTVITSVVIPDTVTSIGAYAFKGCTSLEEVSLSKNLSSAGTDAFMNCTSLESITVPGSLKRIGTNMFYGCSSLVEAVLEEGVQKTGNYAFYNCKALKTISVPSTVVGIGVWCFGYCSLLEAFDVPEKVTTIGSAGFYGCKKISEIILPDTVTAIETHAFRGCKGLLNLRLSENISRIPFRSLNGCGFSHIKIPQNVMYIDKESFYECQNLTSIEIPDGVVTIGEKAFYDCFRMTECIIYGEEVEFGTDAFRRVADNCKIWVPENSATLQSAQEKGITHSVIKDGATVAEQNVYINGELATDNVTIKSGDTISVEYRLITANDAGDDLLFAFLRFDEAEKFLGFKPVYVDINNAQKTVKESLEVTDESQVKIVLFGSIEKIKPLCSAKDFQVE